MSTLVDLYNSEEHDVPKGYPVCADSDNAGCFIAANPANEDEVTVIGLANEYIVDAPVGHGDIMTNGVVECTSLEWPYVLYGSVSSLTTGAVYYLYTGGRLHTVPHDDFCVPIGVALSETELKLAIQLPIKK